MAVLLMFGGSKLSDRLFAHDDLFVTGFHIPANWEAPEKFNLKAYAGMTLYQRVRNKAGENWLLIWWTDPRYYDIWSDQLASKLNLPAKPKFAGTVTEREPPEKPFWSQPKKSLPWVLAAIATTVTLLGNFTQLENYAAWLFATPRIEIVANKLPIRLIQDEMGALECKIHNRSNGTCRISSLVASPQCTADVTLDSSVGPLTPLEPGELRAVTLPLLPQRVGPEQITVSGEAKAGRLRRLARIGPTALKIEIWQRLEESPRVLLQHAYGNAAIYLLTVRHGKPLTKTVAYQATGPDFLTFAKLDGGRTTYNSGPGKGAAVITWEKEATPLAPQEFTLTVRGNEPYSQQQWKQYEKEITVNAAPASEN